MYSTHEQHYALSLSLWSTKSRCAFVCNDFNPLSLYIYNSCKERSAAERSVEAAVVDACMCACVCACFVICSETRR